MKGKGMLVEVVQPPLWQLYERAQSEWEVLPPHTASKTTKLTQLRPPPSPTGLQSKAKAHRKRNASSNSRQRTTSSTTKETHHARPPHQLTSYTVRKVWRS